MSGTKVQLPMGCALPIIIGWLLFWGCVLAIAWHFIAKYW